MIFIFINFMNKTYRLSFDPFLRLVFCLNLMLFFIIDLARLVCYYAAFCGISRSFISTCYENPLVSDIFNMSF